MKTIAVSFLLLLAPVAIKAQNEASIILGKKVKVYSPSLKEDRTIWIYTPDMTA